MNPLIRKLARVIYTYPSKKYLSYMRSGTWHRTRNEHLLRVEGWCEICRKAKACQVHHWTYARLGYEWPQDLCAVCVKCHHDLHMSVMPVAANDNKQLELPLAS